MCFAIIYNQSIHGLIFKFNRKQLPRFQIAGQYLVSIEEDTKWMDQNIDQVCGFLTDNQINRWEHMSSKYLTPANQVLYKLVCSNWIPTMNYTTMNHERLRLIYMIYHHRGFDFLER